MRLLITSGLLLACVASSLTAKFSAPARTPSAQSRDGAGHGHGHSHSHGGIGIHDDFGGGGYDGGLGGGHGGPGGGFELHHGDDHGHGINDISIGGGGYDAPAPSYVEEPAKDTGFYYYYYPVVPEGGGGKKKGLFNSGNKGFFAKMMETIMYPIMYPFMRMYDYFDGRALTARASDYLPMQLFQKIVDMVEEEIYKEECLSRMICQLGKSAEGYETFLQLSDFFVPEEYHAHLRTFKDSALKKSNCALKYKCTSLEPTSKPPKV